MNIAINNQNPGIVPPWLTGSSKTVTQGRNPGIVPPWLTGDQAAKTPNSAVTTSFVRTPAPLSPPNLRAALLLNA
ncbi:MAG: hypothetical protein H7123_00650 [Thermoleophilia bacterium]|nr:hypothetical protein [Thermoleophilia bacterium]